ncbi:MAG: hypothetical protein OEW67_07385 [Cyclobacteriaceae bacterium]|nr:hypothetical protein [Cyclobacteriaceae bacterium]
MIGLLTLFLITCTLSFAQYGLSFIEAKEKGIKLEFLDSIYESGIHDDKSKMVFVGRETEYVEAYKLMLMDLATYLSIHDFKWEKTTKCFNKIYFRSNGSIDYFLFNFKSGDIDATKEQEFIRLLNQFIATYKFSLSSDKKFSQCSPVTYMDL